ncbi:hypothetical protein TNCV_5025641 [Trichonephila clavipes]|nr:hypothetical protein TNCV_5025641 [Trichonephila clavipes]
MHYTPGGRSRFSAPTWVGDCGYVVAVVRLDETGLVFRTSGNPSASSACFSASVQFCEEFISLAFPPQFSSVKNLFRSLFSLSSVL